MAKRKAGGAKAPLKEGRGAPKKRQAAKRKTSGRAAGKGRAQAGSAKAPVPRDVAALRREVASLRSRLDAAVAREAELRRLLEVDARSRKGDKTVVREMMDRLESLEKYLLSTSKRMENVLSALKTHREFLIKLNRKAFASTPRDVMRLELGLMGNTLGILALNGIKVSEELFRDIRRLERDLGSEDAKIGELQRRKEDLDNRFKAEIGQHDVDEILASRKEVYGYR